MTNWNGSLKALINVGFVSMKLTMSMLKFSSSLRKLSCSFSNSGDSAMIFVIKFPLINLDARAYFLEVLALRSMAKPTFLLHDSSRQHANLDVVYCRRQSL